MANPTTNFGWQMPTSTDLVTDLPADFATFGQAVDTTLAELKGGTTGQILSKSSATDMDFTWVTSAGDIEGVTAGTGISGGGTSGTVTITNSMATAITTNGDLIYGTGSGTFTRRGIGSTGQVLTVSGGVPTWATPAGGGKVLQVVMGQTTTAAIISTTTYTDSNLSASITPSSTSSKILVMTTQAYLAHRAADTNTVKIRLMRDATSIVEFPAAAGNYVDVATTVTSSYTTGFVYLDSPATTSSVTYKTQGAPFLSTNSGRITFQNQSTPSTIILMEIGA